MGYSPWGRKEVDTTERPTLLLLQRRQELPWGSGLKTLSFHYRDPTQSLVWEDPLEKDMATHSSILAWRIPWTEEPGELQSIGSQRTRHD